LEVVNAFDELLHVGFFLQGRFALTAASHLGP
jgi:hypothetical protein